MRLTLRSLGLLAALLLAPLAALAQGTLSQQYINAQTGTTYTFLQSDCSKLVTFSNAAAVAVTLPQAGGNGAFFAGCFIDVQNKGVGAVTITPGTSTINGGASIVLFQNQSARIESDANPSGTGNYQIQAQSIAVGGGGFSALKNYLDNGAIAVAQRGTAAITGGTTSGCVVAPATSSYVADEWCVDTNVGSGAGKGQVVTSSPSPLAGFQNSMTVWRNSAALTQPVCAFHEVPTARATQLAGQQATFSVFMQALAGLSADNGNAANLYIMTGTGSDQGLQSMTASPAITPAWTGIASSITQAVTLTTSWARYQVTGTIPSAATEIAVALCFTPTATGAGATDGFAFVGAQLEAGTVPSAFEFRPYAIDLFLALQRYWTITEPAASVSVAPSGQGASTTTCVLSIPLPVQMRAVPTVGFLGTALAGTTWTVTHVVTNTALSTPFLAATTGGSTTTEINLTATVASGLTAGQTCTLTGAGGGGIIGASADL